MMLFINHCACKLFLSPVPRVIGPINFPWNWRALNDLCLPALSMNGGNSIMPLVCFKSQVLWNRWGRLQRLPATPTARRPAQLVTDLRHGGPCAGVFLAASRIFGPWWARCPFYCPSNSSLANSARHANKDRFRLPLVKWGRTHPSPSPLHSFDGPMSRQKSEF